MSAQPTTTSTAAAGGPDEESLTIARAAATELARLLPSTVPLEVAAYDPAHGPDQDAVAVRASFVGATSADLVVVADQAVSEALEGSGGTVSLADALRPALEAATATLGAGVLDTAAAAPVGNGLDDDGLIAFALTSGPDAEVSAWFGILLRQGPESLPQQRAAEPVGAPAPQGANGTNGTNGAESRPSMRLLNDVELTLTAEIGRTRLPVRQVLELVPGTVLELDRAAGSAADLMVNGRLVARGEVVVVDEDYGIRITEIVATEGA